MHAGHSRGERHRPETLTSVAGRLLAVSVFLTVWGCSGGGSDNAQPGSPTAPVQTATATRTTEPSATETHTTLPTSTETPTQLPSPTPTTQSCDRSGVLVVDPAEGRHPDFRSLAVTGLPDTVRLELSLHPGDRTVASGTFARIVSSAPWLVAFKSDTFELRQDLEGDERFETVVRKGNIDRISAHTIALEIPELANSDVAMQHIYVASTWSDDRIPDFSTAPIQCPTLHPTPTPTATNTPAPVASWREEFNRNRAKWSALGLDSYRFRYKLHCYCFIPSDVSITVHRDQIGAVHEYETRTPVDFSNRYAPAVYLTINEIFDLVERAIEYPAHRFQVTYHSERGYPTSLYIDLDGRIIDEEVGIDASQIEVVVPPSLTPTAVRSDTPTAMLTATITPTPTPPPFVDNGDGTITDIRSGRKWVKKVALDGVEDPDNPHDADNRYPWAGRCADFGFCQPPEGQTRTCPHASVCRSCPANSPSCTPDQTARSWIAQLNDARFAGHSDWRLPTDRDFSSLFDPALFGPNPPLPPVHPELHASECGEGCTDLFDPGCSCTSPDRYWTNVLLQSQGMPPQLTGQGWTVRFGKGFGVSAATLSDHAHVRAVRGPSN